MCWHKWSKWEQYEAAMVRKFKDGKSFQFTECRQKRYCKKCGKEENEKIY